MEKESFTKDALTQIESKLLSFACSKFGIYTMLGSVIMAFVYYRVLMTHWIVTKAGEVFIKTEATAAPIKQAEVSDEAKAEQEIAQANALQAPVAKEDWNKQ